MFNFVKFIRENPSLKEDDLVPMMADSNLFHKSSKLHLAVCKALREGKTHEQVAEMFDLNDGRAVRYIKEHKCKDCR